MGGDLSRPLPYPDVFGFLRCYPGEGPSSLIPALLEQLSGPLAVQVASNPVFQLLQVLLSPELRSVDAPLVVFFLDPAVHGYPFAAAFPCDEERLHGALQRSPLEWNAATGTVTLGLRSSLDPLRWIQGRSFSRSVSREGSADSSPPETLPESLRSALSVTCSVISSEGIAYVLPRREGLRNLRETLRVTHALDPEGEPFEFLRCELARPLQRNASLRAMATAPFMTMAFLSGNLGERDATPLHGLGSASLALDTVNTAFDLVESIDQVFLALHPGLLEAFVKPVPEGFLAEILQLFPARDRDVLLEGSPAGQVRCSVSVDPARVREFLESKAAQGGRWRRRGRHRVLFLQQDPLMPALRRLLDGVLRERTGVAVDVAPVQRAELWFADTPGESAEPEAAGSGFGQLVRETLISARAGDVREWSLKEVGSANGATLEALTNPAFRGALLAGSLPSGSFLLWDGTTGMERAAQELQRWLEGAPALAPVHRDTLPAQASAYLFVDLFSLVLQGSLEADALGLVGSFTMGL